MVSRLDARQVIAASRPARAACTLAEMYRVCDDAHAVPCPVWVTSAFRDLQRGDGSLQADELTRMFIMDTALAAVISATRRPAMQAGERDNVRRLRMIRLNGESFPMVLTWGPVDGPVTWYLLSLASEEIGGAL